MLRAGLGVLLGLLVAACGRAADPLAGRSVADWLRDLDDQQALVREEAIEVLAQAKVREALPKLERMLEDKQPSVRRRAAVALWKIDGQTKPARAALTDVLRDPQAPQRREALLFLRDLDPPADEYIPLLLALMEDRDPVIVASAQNLLRFNANRALPAILSALPKADLEARLRLVQFLASLGFSNRERVVPVLRELLEKSDDRTRVAAARALMTFSPATAELAAALARVADGKDALARREAFQTALSLQPRRKDLLPVYKAALRDTDGPTRARAIEAIWELDRTALKEQMPVLIEMLRERGTSRSAALNAIQRFGPDARDALPVIAEMLARLDDATPGEDLMLVSVLPALGPDAVPHIVKLLGHPSAVVRSQAAAALWRTGPGALRELLPLLSDSRVDVRRTAFQSVSMMTVGADAALPQMINGLKDSDGAIRQYAVTALLNIGPAGKDAIEPLLSLLKAESPGDFQRSQIVQVLGRIGPAARDAVPILRQLLKSDGPYTRLRSAEALWLIDGDRKEALPILLNGLKTDRNVLYMQPNPVLDFAVSAGVPPAEVLEALRGWLGKEPGMKRSVVVLVSRYYPTAKEAVPYLREWVKDPDLGVRREAALALAHFGDDGKDAAPALADILRQRRYPDPQIISALSELGPAAGEALPVLQQMWTGPQSIVLKPKLAEAIIRIDPKKGKEQLDYLHDQIKSRASPSIKLATAMALVQVEPTNSDLQATLLEYVRDPARTHAAAAMTLLGALKKDAKGAAPALREHLKGPNALLRGRAADALWRIEGKADEVVPVLTSLLAERTERAGPGAAPARFAVAASAAATLGEIGPPAAAALPELRKCLGQSDSSLRRAAAEAIGRIEKK